MSLPHFVNTGKKKAYRSGHASTPSGGKPDEVKGTILPEIWDEDVFVNRMANYLKRFEYEPDIVLKALEEAIQLSGLKAARVKRW